LTKWEKTANISLIMENPRFETGVIKIDPADESNIIGDLEGTKRRLEPERIEQFSDTKAAQLERMHQRHEEEDRYRVIKAQYDELAAKAELEAEVANAIRKSIEIGSSDYIAQLEREKKMREADKLAQAEIQRSIKKGDEEKTIKAKDAVEIPAEDLAEVWRMMDSVQEGVLGPGEVNRTREQVDQTIERGATTAAYEGQEHAAPKMGSRAEAFTAGMSLEDLQREERQRRILSFRKGIKPPQKLEATRGKSSIQLKPQSNELPSFQPSDIDNAFDKNVIAPENPDKN
jgi:hypothetical protein